MQIQLKNVRLAFANAIFRAKSINDGDPRFSAIFIIDPASQKKMVKMIEATMDTVAEEKWTTRAPKIITALRKQDKLCLHDGDTKEEYDGFEDMVYVSAASKTAPLIIDRDRSQLSERSGRPYSGCYVNAIIDVWAQDDSSYGKRINAALKGIQFLKDGEPFGGGKPADADDFDDLGLDDDDDDLEDDDADLV